MTRSVPRQHSPAIRNDSTAIGIKLSLLQESHAILPEEIVNYAELRKKSSVKNWNRVAVAISLPQSAD
jgi:hypothetical protein